MAPRDFGRMSVGWFLNHSTTPNASHKNFYFRASKRIRVGDEVLVDYQTLREGS